MIIMTASLLERSTQPSLPLNATVAHLVVDHGQLRDFEIFAVVLMSIIIFVAFHGNLFIIIVIFINPQLRSSMANIFIINLCIVDLLASVLSIPLSLSTFVQGEQALEKTICEVSGFLNTFVMVASMLSLCVISVERFYSIALPMHHAGHATPCMYFLAVLSVWTLSLILAALPSIGVNSYSFRPSKRICSYHWFGGSTTDRAFIIVIFTISFLIPSIILITMYIGIFRVAKKTATSVGPQVCRSKLSTQMDARNHATTQNNSSGNPIFSVSSDVVLRTIHQPNSNTFDNLQTTVVNENKSNPAVQGTDPVSLKAVSFDGRNGSVADACKDNSSAYCKCNPGMNCSKVLCVCKDASIHCIAGPSISNSNVKDTDSKLGQPSNCVDTNKFSCNNNALPKHSAVSHDTGKLKTSHMKAFKTLMIIVLSYFVLWSPYFVCDIYGLNHETFPSPAIELIATWLSFASYAVNPCLYGLMNRVIREELSQFLKCVLHCCICCSCSCEARGCRCSCKRPSNDDEDDDDFCPGGAESFFQFLQRTQASDASPPASKNPRKSIQLHTTNGPDKDLNSNNAISENQSNCAF